MANETDMWKKVAESNMKSNETQAQNKTRGPAVQVSK